MLRSVLLGKMSISILACFVVGGFCMVYPARQAFGFTESVQWRGLGVFFLTLAIAQILALYFMMKKKK